MDPNKVNRNSFTWITPRVLALTPGKTLQSDSKSTNSVGRIHVPIDLYRVSYSAPGFYMQLPMSGHLDLRLAVQVIVPCQAVAVAAAAAAELDVAVVADVAACAAAAAAAAAGGGSVARSSWWEVQWEVLHECEAIMRVKADTGQLIQMMECLSSLCGWRLVGYEVVSNCS